MRVLGVVPARLGSTRLPNKPLQLLAGDPPRVKVVTDGTGRALYFSRAVLPHRRDPDHAGKGLYWQHLGIYAYTRDALARWVSADPSPAELAEQLEQLRALHCGLT